MPREDDQLRTRLAPVIAALSGLKAVAAALCFGSYALGTFDAQSDIDLFAVCRPDLIPLEQRRRAFAVMEGVTDLRLGPRDSVWDTSWCPVQDAFRLNGQLIEVHWNTLDWFRTVVQKVTEEGVTSFPGLSFRAHTMLGLLEHSVLLLDPEGVLRRMKSELYPYPPRLKQALLRESWPVLQESLEEMKNYVARRIGNTAFHFHLERFLESLVTAVFALNERYDPATKRVEQVYATLNRLPHDFLTRYHRLLEIPLTETGRRELVHALEVLTEEFGSMLSDP